MTDIILTGPRIGGRHQITDVATDSNIHPAGHWVLDPEQAHAVTTAWQNAPATPGTTRSVDVVDDGLTFLLILDMDGETTIDRWEHVSTYDGPGYSTAEMPVDVEIDVALDWLTPPCLICRQTGTLAVTRAEASALHRGELVQDVLPTLAGPMREQLISGIHPACWRAAFGRP
jgi:hypothetical protein